MSPWIVVAAAIALSCSKDGAPTPEASSLGDGSPDDGRDASAASSGLGADAPSARQLCGADGEACCPAPLPPCGTGLQCDGAQQHCVAAPAELGARLCRTALDCAGGENCCLSGQLGTCVASQHGDECAYPDLVAGVGQLSIETRSFSSDDCSLHCVAGPGRYRMLTFYPRIVNVGSVPLIFGTPDSAGIESDCNGSYIDDFVRFELIAQASGAVASTGTGALRSCIGSSFECELMGMVPGFYVDLDPSYDGCSWVDISGVPSGDYTLRVQVNPNQAVPEKRFDNNTAEIPIHIPQVDPLASCTEAEATSFPATSRECGWTKHSSAECVPGEAVTLGCPACEGSPMLRVCAGDAECSTGAALAFGDATVLVDGTSVAGTCPASATSCEYVSPCPLATFSCPGAGSYTTLISSAYPAEVFGCDPSVQAPPDAGTNN